MRFQVGLQHLRQIGIDRAARFAVAMSLPSAQLAVTAHDQVGEPIPTGATAFRALDPKHVELADQVAEDDRAVAGHNRLIRSPRRRAAEPQAGLSKHLY